MKKEILPIKKKNNKISAIELKSITMLSANLIHSDSASSSIASII